MTAAACLWDPGAQVERLVAVDITQDRGEPRSWGRLAARAVAET
jgi:hypothetical protein